MRRRVLILCASLPFFVNLCWSESSISTDRVTASVEIDLAEHGSSFWGRYVISGGRGKTTGWLLPSADAQVVRLARIPVGPANLFRAILYAPGCSLETLDIPIKEAKTYTHTFNCEGVPLIDVGGSVARLDRLYGREVEIQAKYLAYWAHSFFGNNDGIVTEIPVGSVATLDTRDRFVLAVPNLLEDKIAGSKDHEGELQIWARDKSSGHLIAQLRLASTEDAIFAPTRLGGLPLRREYSSNLVFLTCSANPSGARDEFGFSIRPGADDACGP